MTSIDLATLILFPIIGILLFAMAVQANEIYNLKSDIKWKNMQIKELTKQVK